MSHFANLPPDPAFVRWRREARAYLARRAPPERVHWEALDAAQAGLFQSAPQDFGAAQATVRVPRAFAEAAPYVAAHRDPGRWDLMYRLLWRLTQGEPHLFEVAVDADVARFTRMLRAVQRDIHKCHAFVRFVATPSGAYVAWYRPDHRIVRHAVAHFAKRYPHMPFVLHTALESVRWDTQRLTMEPGIARDAVPGLGDDTQAESLWATYYASIFNPARLKLKAMRQEMPARYWSVMPETRLIDRLVAEAPARVQKFHAEQPQSGKDYLPANPQDLPALRQAAAACAACAFAKQATQTVFGAGAAAAQLMFVGEQPGDEEDLRGQPFVGPSGQLLDQALQEAGIPRQEAYVTNAVKHFKWTPRGKKRLHQRPLARDVAACKPWLAAEMAVVQPRVLVCLGATAAQSVFGKVVKIGAVRGAWHATAFCDKTWVTAHPSSILRQPDEAARAAAYATLVQDLRIVRAALQ